jgi:hypothetical protein
MDEKMTAEDIENIDYFMVEWPESGYTQRHKFKTYQKALEHARDVKARAKWARLSAVFRVK